MKLRPLLLISLICLIPLGILAWTALRWAKSEQLMVQQQFRELIEARLQDISDDVANHFATLERQLDHLVALDDFDTETLRSLCRNSPQVLQLFVVSPRGELAYPNPSGELNATEQAFLINASQMFTGKDLQSAVLRSEQASANTDSKVETGRISTVLENDVPSKNLTISRSELVDQTMRNLYQSTMVEGLTRTGASSGWFIWYWDRGINLIYWQRRPSGHIVGCALDRARWISEIIAILPSTAEPDVETSPNRGMPSISPKIRLINTSGEVVYQWGQKVELEDGQPFCEISLCEPLTPWRLQCFVSPAQLATGTGAATKSGAFLGLLGLAAILTSILILFVREYARDMRDAAQQVSFVNQVSHELRTPLTNISMYAELLERDIDNSAHPNDSILRQRLDIILNESQRLGRLIANVLTYARSKGKALTLQPRSMSPDEVLQAVVERSRPTFEQLNIQIDCDWNARETMQLDSDVLEQIVNNLLSNVEKYAQQGHFVRIATRSDGEILHCEVEDRGPGVQREQREAIFKPFVRLSSNVSHAAGTGIGLTIARDLARLHGGDLILVDSNTGCRFLATLRNASSTNPTSKSKLRA